MGIIPSLRIYPPLFPTLPHINEPFSFVVIVRMGIFSLWWYQKQHFFYYTYFPAKNNVDNDYAGETR
jgi:hypothetical protein